MQKLRGKLMVKITEIINLEYSLLKSESYSCIAGGNQILSCENVLLEEQLLS